MSPLLLKNYAKSSFTFWNVHRLSLVFTACPLYSISPYFYFAVLLLVWPKSLSTTFDSKYPLQGLAYLDFWQVSLYMYTSGPWRKYIHHCSDLSSVPDRFSHCTNILLIGSFCSLGYRNCKRLCAIVQGCHRVVRENMQGLHSQYLSA